MGIDITWIGLILTVIIGAFSIITSFLFSKNTSNRLYQIKSLIPKITSLFSASEKIGIYTAYPNRKVALRFEQIDKDTLPFVKRFLNEKKLIIVGSSLKGLKMYVENLSEILQHRNKNNYESKFMLTHPCFSGLREKQERRGEGKIKQEIEEMFGYLTNTGVDIENSLRFYRGTPTCFMIITSNSMLLNPYPYQIEAYWAFCLEVRRLPQIKPGGESGKDIENYIPPQVDQDRFKAEFIKLLKDPKESDYDYSEDIGPDIYGQFYRFHYLFPWFSRQAVTTEEFRKTCIKCPFLSSGFSKECPLERKIQKEELTIIEGNGHQDLKLAEDDSAA
jgi:hypothetical protein